MSSVKKIVIFRALKLGDMLCSIPAIRGIRKLHPDAHIALTGHPQMEALFSRYGHYVDEFIPFAGFPGMPESPIDSLKVWDTIKYIQDKEFDLAVQLHGSGELSNTVVSLFNSRKVIGHYRTGNFRHTSHDFKPYPENVHEVERCLSILELFGYETTDKSLEFYIMDEDYEELNRKTHYPTIKNPYICLHSGASNEFKRWSDDKFAKLADWLCEKGLEVVFTGSLFETPLIKKITSQMKHVAHDFSHYNLELGPLAALIKNSRGLICNDTGVSHLAVALKVPSIVLFIQTDPVRWAPLDSNLHKWVWNPDVDKVFQLSKDFLLKEKVQ